MHALYTHEMLWLALRQEGGAAGSGDPGSTFRDVWKKLRALLPFMWPTGDWLLQLSVLFCMFLLVIGRVVNVFVPIFDKKIGEDIAQYKILSEQQKGIGKI